MQAPPLPKDEIDRQRAVDSYHILNTAPETDFDNLTKIVASICEVPVVLITLLDKDRNWFKSHYGISFNESPRNTSFCGHAILNKKEVMIVEDARKDERFCDNPLVKELKQTIFYMGVPLVNEDGHALGTLCVFDDKPRQLSENQIKNVKALAKQVVNLFELKRKNRHLQNITRKVEDTNKMLKDFAGVISHDIKLPLSNMLLTTDILTQKYKDGLGKDGLQYIKNIKQSTFTLHDYINGMLEYYSSDEITRSKAEDFELTELLEDVVELLSITQDCEINFPEKKHDISTNKIALEQIFLNLIANALKYSDKEHGQINIRFAEDNDFYNFEVSDNGMGIPKDKQSKIFELFTTATEKDRNGRAGTGIGLSTVHKIVNSLGGSIRVTSKIGEGATFHFSVAKDL